MNEQFAATFASRTLNFGVNSPFTGQMNGTFAGGPGMTARRGTGKFWEGREVGGVWG